MILDNKYFVLVMSISITTVTLLIAFNILGIYEERLITSGLTGLVIVTENLTSDKLVEKNNESQIPINTQSQSQELYTTKSYFVYILLIGILSFSIIALITRIILPKLKEFT